MKHERENGEIPEIDPEIPENAVSVYGQSDAMDDFPVLKAFQQYIDAEQAKARKRMLMLCVFFGVMMIIVIAVFLAMLLNVSARNQSLNDRLVEYAMKDRERASSPIVVQPPQQPDNSAILALTVKLEEMQKKLEADREKAEEAKRQAAIEASKPKGPTLEELEIKRLKALLAAEKEKQKAESERLRQIELEEYRRKHYPEFYKKDNDSSQDDSSHKELMREIDKILKDSSDTKAITYYDEEEPQKATKPKPPQKKNYTIPVDIRGSSGHWSIPED